MLADIEFDDLPPAWTTFELKRFSQSKPLWDFQQEALKFGLKALWKYFEDFGDYHPGEAGQATEERKRRFFEWYRNNDLEDDLDISLENARSDIRALLEEHYPTHDGKVSYMHFINRIGFWMATGSGKTLVLVKLIELLWRLIKLGEIPPHGILVLTYRDDLIDQLREHVDEFNHAGNGPFIRLRDLRDYPDVKREHPSLFRQQEATVFFYRSDNLSDEQKERIIDYHNYENHGRWYVLLDEAHKGDKQDSKRQHIYSVLARKGFLFNFSATFTDPRDILTTAYDFNLARFVEAGYGKHIAVLKQENRAFQDDEDYTGEEKQKIVLKALMMLSLASRAQELVLSMAGDGLYHRSMMLALVHTVNTEQADLKLFFRELERVGRGEVPAATWDAAKGELWAELSQSAELIFEEERFSVDGSALEALTLEGLLQAVYNASAPGEIEVLQRPSNRKELAFKLKSADRPFALIKIGDVSDWLREELEGYEIVEGFEDEGFFEHLNDPDSDINILMGSQAFYEGWDSNRPNVITYINIGLGAEARKFILQSLGRGLRIEPLPNKRRRLRALYNAGEVDESLFRSVKALVLPLESLVIFGTNREAIESVIKELEHQQHTNAGSELALYLNEDAVRDHPLLIPTYAEGDKPLIEQREVRKFPIEASEQELLSRYVGYLGDDRLLLAHHEASPAHIRRLHRALEDTARFFTVQDARRYRSVELILPRLFAHFETVPMEMKGLKHVGEEIRHFRHVRVLLEDISGLREHIAGLRERPRRMRELRAEFEAKGCAFDELVERIEALPSPGQVHIDGKNLDLRILPNHYYIPLILAEDERVAYIRHVIRAPSEVRFIRQLEAYLHQVKHGFQAFDWWLFSKLDESLDSVFVPYYDPSAARVREFYPDFIFWMQKGQDYFIIFVDPKGMEHASYLHKIDGYEELFLDESGDPLVLEHEGLRVRIYLRLHTSNASAAPSKYSKYWFETPSEILDCARAPWGAD